MQRQPYVFDFTEETQGQFIWFGGDGVEHVIYRVGEVDDGIAVVDKSETGWGRPPQLDLIEVTPDQWRNQYRDSTFAPRIYGFVALLNATERDAFERLRGQWEDWHTIRNGEGVFRRITAAGLTRDLDCFPLPGGARAAQWNWAETFRQLYTAANPFWRNTEQQEVEATFDPTQDVTFDYTNNGDVAATPLLTITGIVTNPSIKSGGYRATVLHTTTNADDSIVIDTRPNGTRRRTVTYYEHGTGDGEFLSMSSDSRYITIPVGVSTLSIRCDAGSPALLLQAYDYYESLY